MTDLARASEFLETSARLIDRRRYALMLGDDDAEPVLTALSSYRNPDGGFGWALHPDLRSQSSQPVGALHGFEVLAEVAPRTSPLGAALCDWLERVSLDDGALPFALAGAGGPGSAPLWAGSDPAKPSLLITSAVAGFAQRVADHDSAVADHPWLARATDYCLGRAKALGEPSMAIEFRFVLALLDAIAERSDDAARELERLAGLMPASVTMPVPGGAEGERMRPVDFSPEPDRPLRQLLPADAIERDLDELAAEQADDGYWDVDFQVYSPAAVLEWRGEATLRAIRILRANGRLG